MNEAAPKMSPEARAAIAAFLTTLDPPDQWKRYAIPVTDGRDRTWCVMAYPPAFAEKLAAAAEVES